MAIDPNTLAPGYIESHAAGTTHVGESATRLFQVRVVIKALESELSGFRWTAKANAGNTARALLGSTTRNKKKLIAELRTLETRLAANVTVR